MSIDIYLAINTGGAELVDVVEVGNYTHNCQPMWSHALEQTGCDLSLCDFDGMKASAAKPILEKAVIHMFNPRNREKYESMNPANGWGERKSATDFLRDFWRACLENPKCTIRTSC